LSQILFRQHRYQLCFEDILKYVVKLRGNVNDKDVITSGTQRNAGNVAERELSLHDFNELALIGAVLFLFDPNNEKCGFRDDELSLRRFKITIEFRNDVGEECPFVFTYNSASMITNVVRYLLKYIPTRAFKTGLSKKLR
jgi:hypothetical protein